MAKARPEWTDGRMKSFVVSALRSATRRYPPIHETRTEAKTDKKINPKTKRLAQHYACAACGEEYPASETQVDHILPVVDPTQGFVDWNTYIPRLFCPKENLQLLCSSCHDLKTMEEKQSKQLTSKSKQIKAPSVSTGKSRKMRKTSS